MDFEMLLQRYKDVPKREAVALLLTDVTLFRYAVIWLQVPVRRYMDYAMDGSWRALWECVDVDYEAIALLADDVEVKARKNVERLKGLQIIYPDGTVQPLAEQIITKRISSALLE